MLCILALSKAVPQVPGFTACVHLLQSGFLEMEIFIFALTNVQHGQSWECKLLSLTLGQAKIAIYVRRRSKIDH